MKTYLLPHQMRFFQQKGWIIFDSFFSEEFISRIIENIQKDLEKKSHKHFSDISFLEAFASSFDLFRTIPSIKELLQNKQLIQIISSLMKVENIRIGFDQVIASSIPVQNFLEDSVQSLSPVQPLLGTIFICLKETTLQKKEEKANNLCLPLKLGEIAVINPSYDQVFIDLAKLNSFFYLQLGYTEISSRYYINDKNPNGNFLKTLGYAAGDSLKNSTHPLLHS